MTDPINVLFITADQWRGDCLSALNHPTVKTPHLDALAGEGVLFRNHFAQGVPCGPSRASLYTGTYLMNHRSVRNGVPLDARFTNIALEARKLGYDPALIGYTDTSPDPRSRHPGDPTLKTYTGVLPGFTQMVPGSEDSRNSAWRRYLIAQGYEVSLSAGEIRSPAPGQAEVPGRGPTYAPAFYAAEHSDTAFAFDQALAFVTGRGDQPWFLHLSVERPHPPFIAPEPYNALYDPEQVPGFKGAASAEDEARQHPYLAYMTRHHLERDGHDPARHPATELARRQLRATYYGLMSEVDHHLGRLLALLKDRGLYNRTLIVFTSDHGEQLWDHWLLGKEAYFDQSVHVPLILKPPGGLAEAPRGHVVEAFTEHVDVMPTILELLGADFPLQCDGASLAGFLGGRTPDHWRQEVHWELDFRDVVSGRPERELDLALDDCALTVIRDRRYKYIHFHALPPLFFDLSRDPDECHDRAGDPAMASTILAYAQKMLSWRARYQERVLTGIRLTTEGPFECPPDRRRRSVSLTGAGRAPSAA